MLKHNIGGEWLESTSTESVAVVNPATGDELAKCPLGTAQEVDLAVRAAQSAYTNWRQVPTADRVQHLFKLKSLMEFEFDDLAATITKEHGKTFAESKGSVRRAIQMVETACGMPSLMMGDVSEDIAAGIDSQCVRRPLGVFAGIAPFNFPAMVPFWFWPFAVASGNTFVIKPSERVPLTQKRIMELIAESGFPPGVMNMVHGGKEVVNALCSHPEIKGVSFVGSTSVARHVYSLATQHGKRAQALGGAKNFMVVLPDAELDKSARTTFESITGCAGERCLAGSVVLSVGDETHKEITERVTLLAKETIVGDGMDKNTQMGPLISQAAKDRVVDLIESAVSDGAKIVVDGRQGVDDMPGYFLKPTVIEGVTRDMRIAKEEIFGPVVLLAKVESLDEAIEWLNSSEYANTTSLFTSNGGAARKFSYEVAPSMIGINIGVPAPMSFFSFGGSKASFFGDTKVHGKDGVRFFTDPTVTIHRWSSESSIW